jgi:acyl-CoA reductase-like NAD-dependent aldehyde dehydrogenase
LETGKTLTEARGEMGAVLGKFDLTFRDAREHIAPKPVSGGPYPAEIRYLPRGPSVVIGPFNFPLHLANGAIVPHLLAGNTVLFKPSPLASVVAERYAALFEKCLPEGVFQVVQGGGETGMALSVAPEVRAVCFTGSVEVGRVIAQATATDFSKSVALELGGKNALILLEDGDPVAAAKAAAAGICATAGQRCNDTSRAIIHQSHVGTFCEVLREELLQFQPGDPCSPDTNLGVLINEAAHRRYAEQLVLEGDWILKGAVLPEHEGRPGYYVRPSARLWSTFAEGMQCPIIGQELFVPLMDVFVAASDEEMLRLHNAAPFGLTASVFTASRTRFETIGRHLRVGNLYANIPTTHSPSVLPFGGLGNSGNGKPAGRGFIRYVVDEQSVQFPEGF